MRFAHSLLFLALVSICTACNWEAFFQDGETYFEGRITYQDTNEGAVGSSAIIAGVQDSGFSGGFSVSSDTVAVDEEGYFEILIIDHKETYYYSVQVIQDNVPIQVKDYNCNDNVSTCAGLQPDEEHSVIIQI